MTAKGEGPGWLAAGRWALDTVLRREVTRVARSERATPTVALTTAGQDGLQTYLEGTVAGQLRQQLGRIPTKSRSLTATPTSRSSLSGQCPVSPPGVHR